VPISGAVLSRYAIPRLRTESEDAQLLVLGTRGLGAVGAVVSGSVARSVVPRSACPVVVVREEHGGLRHGSVVVGVDHRSTSDAALQFGLEEARARGVGLVAVHAWRDAGFGSERFLADYAPTMVAAQRRCLTGDLVAWREKYPDVAVQEVVRMHQPAGTLLDAAVGAALLVVGSRRRGPLRGLVLGSVGQTVLHRAPCPVAVVPPVAAVER
jgi:nucleotide-binding universal stress UspA family protein